MNSMIMQLGILLQVCPQEPFLPDSEQAEPEATYWLFTQEFQVTGHKN
jgi:hypothetical protein